MKVRKKPVTVEAVQYLGENTEEVLNFIARSGTKGLVDSDGISIQTPEGTMTVCKCDYVILGTHDEVYPCKPMIFEAIYEVVEP